MPRSATPPRPFRPFYPTRLQSVERSLDHRLNNLHKILNNASLTMEQSLEQLNNLCAIEETILNQQKPPEHRSSVLDQARMAIRNIERALQGINIPVEPPLFDDEDAGLPAYPGLG